MWFWSAAKAELPPYPEVAPPTEGHGMSTQAERRQNFRIEDTIYLEYQRVNEMAETENSNLPLADVCLGMRQLREMDLQAKHALANIRKHHSDIAHYLTILDHKIDTLSRMVGSIGMGSDVQPTTRVNIGSGGMAFDTREALEKGEQLSLKMVLFPSHQCLQLMARVAYSHGGNGDGNYLTGLTFEDMPESQQDALIQHLLEVQSAPLRRERE
jgi:c-di-GMP-binding flagellar brake protein YcgR